MNTFIKISILSCITMSFLALGAFAETEPQASAPVAEKLSKAKLDQADTYVLYSLAVRDANAAQDSTMNTSKKNNITTYTFKDHVIHECGSHLTGTIQVTENTSVKLISVNFPKVRKNPLDIKSFSLDIAEDKIKKGDIKGIGVVNGEQFDVKDLMAIPGYDEAVAKIN